GGPDSVFASRESVKAEHVGHRRVRAREIVCQRFRLKTTSLNSVRHKSSNRPCPHDCHSYPLRAVNASDNHARADTGLIDPSGRGGYTGTYSDCVSRIGDNPDAVRILHKEFVSQVGDSRWEVEGNEPCRAFVRMQDAAVGACHAYGAAAIGRHLD